MWPVLDFTFRWYNQIILTIKPNDYKVSASVLKQVDLFIKSDAFICEWPKVDYNKLFYSLLLLILYALNKIEIKWN